MECASCGDPVESGFAFCEGCGKPVGDKTVTSTAATPSQGTASVNAVALRHPEPPEVQCLSDMAVSATHRGQHHLENQDSVLLHRLGSGDAVLVVADGVSSAFNSRAAADLAASVVVEALASAGETVSPQDRMRQALLKAHEALCAMPYAESSGLEEPECTIVVALVGKQRVTVGWVGDSRLYLLSPRGSRLLTEDDSWLNEQLAAGMDYEVAMRSPDAHCITQCLGMRDGEPMVHVTQSELSDVDYLMLCTDGLWGYLSDPQRLWSRASGESFGQTLVERCVSLVDLANQSGGQDNISVAFFRAHQH